MDERLRQFQDLVADEILVENTPTMDYGSGHVYHQFSLAPGRTMADVPEEYRNDTGKWSLYAYTIAHGGRG